MDLANPPSKRKSKGSVMSLAFQQEDEKAQQIVELQKHLRRKEKEHSKREKLLTGKRRKRRKNVDDDEMHSVMQDSILENFYMESIVLGRKTEFTEVEGNVELQRLCAALRFLIDEKDLQTRIVEQMEEVEDEQVGDSAQMGSLVAATKWHSTIQIGDAPVPSDSDSEDDAPVAPPEQAADDEAPRQLRWDVKVEAEEPDRAMNPSQSSDPMLKQPLVSDPDEEELTDQEVSVSGLDSVFARRKVPKKVSRGGVQLSAGLGPPKRPGKRKSFMRLMHLDENSAEASELEQQVRQDSERLRHGSSGDDDDDEEEMTEAARQLELERRMEEEEQRRQEMLQQREAEEAKRREQEEKQQVKEPKEVDMNGRRRRSSRKSSYALPAKKGRSRSSSRARRHSRQKSMRNSQDSVFGEEYVKYVAADLAVSMDERFHNIWEDLELDQEIPTVTEFEMTMFNMCTEFLQKKCQQAGGSGDHYPFFWMIQDLISTLRQVEVSPVSFHRGGFLYQIDNLLAVLMYRRKAGKKRGDKLRALQEQAKEQMEEKATVANQQWIDKLNACLEIKNKTGSAMLMSTLVTFIVALGIFLVYLTWRNTALETTDDALLFLNQENELRARSIVARYLAGPPTVETYYSTELERYRHEANSLVTSLYSNATTNDPTGRLDRFLVSMVKRFNIKSAYIATKEGDFIAATRNGDIVPTDYNGATKTITIQATLRNNTAGCLYNYAVGVDGARNATNGTLIECGYDPTARPWYTGAGTTGASGAWTPLYRFVTVSGGTEADNVGLSYGTPYHDFNGTFAGVFGTDLLMRDLGILLKDINTFRNGLVYVTDSQWNVVASSVLQVDINSASLNVANGYATATSASSDAITRTIQYFRQEFALPVFGGAINPSLLQTLQQTNDQIYNRLDFGMQWVMAQLYKPGALLSSPSSFDGSTDLKSDHNQWMLVVVVPETDFRGKVTENGWITLILGAATMVFAIGVGFFSVRLVSASEVDDPLERLEMGRISRVTTEHIMPGGGVLMDSPKSSRTMTFNSFSSQTSAKPRLPPGLRKVKRRQQFMFVFFSLVIGTYLLIVVNWTTSTSDVTSEITDQLISEAQNRVFEDVFDFLSIPPRVNWLQSDSVNREMFLETDLLNSSFTGYDRSFFHIMQGLANPGNSFLVEYAYLGLETGEIWGAQLYNRSTSPAPGFDHFSIDYNGTDVETSSEYGLRFWAKDRYNGNCYTSYVASPGSDLGNNIPALVRNPGLQISSNPGCLFDPRERPWYTKAKSQGTVVWTDVYQFTSTKELGITAAIPVYYKEPGFNNSKVLWGVFAVDVALSHLNEFLNRIQVSNKTSAASVQQTGSAVTFIVQRGTGELVASSSLQDQALMRSDGLVAATRSGDPITSSTIKFLLAREGGLAVLTSRQDIERPLETPITAVDTLQLCCSKLDWIVVVNLPFDDFFGNFDRQLTVSLIVAGGVFLVVLYLIFLSISSFKSSVVNEDLLRSNKAQTLLQEMSGETVAKKTLEKIMQKIRPFIVEACAHEWRRKIFNDSADYRPPSFDTIQQHYYKQAVAHIKNARKGRNIISVCYLQSRNQNLDKQYSEEKDSLFGYKLYVLYTSTTYQLFLYMVICLHIALAFLEPDTYEDMRANGVSPILIFAEIACLGVEIVDVFVNWLINYHWKTRNFLDPGKQKDVDVMYAILVFAVLADFVSTLVFGVSAEYLFPLRPCLLVMRNKEIREAGIGFVSTVYYARNVFLLFLCILLAAAAMGTVLFRNALDTDGPQSSFRNFIRAITTAFVYLSTGENYTEVVYPTYDVSPWYVIYFITFVILGMFFVLAMVIGMFQDGFQQQRLARLKEIILFSRVGTVAAFILMDLDGSDSLSLHEFRDFLRTLRPNLSSEYIHRTFQKLNADDDGCIDVAEFVNGIEGVISAKLDPAVDHKALSKWRTALRVLIFDRRWYHQIILLVVLANVWLLSLYGSAQDLKRLDTLAAAMLAFYLLEIWMRIMAYGWDEFWNYAAYHLEKEEASEDDVEEEEDAALAPGEDLVHEVEKAPYVEKERGSHGFARMEATQHFSMVPKDVDDYDSEEDIEEEEVPLEQKLEAEKQAEEDLERQQQDKLEHNAANVHQMYANRFDFGVIMFSFLAWCATKVGTEGNVYYEDSQDSLRFVLTFPVLRLFSVIKRTRLLVFTLIKLLPDFVSVLAIMFVVFFFYAVVGVWLFEGEWEVLQEDKPQANFETLTGAMLSLFQLLVGEGWHEVMYASILASRGFGAGWYFVSFIAIVTLLFVNTFIGIILHSFQKIFKSARVKRKASKERRQRLALKKAKLAAEAHLRSRGIHA